MSDMAIETVRAVVETTLAEIKAEHKAEEDAEKTYWLGWSALYAAVTRDSNGDVRITVNSGTKESNWHANVRIAKALVAATSGKRITRTRTGGAQIWWTYYPHGAKRDRQSGLKILA